MRVAETLKIADLKRIFESFRVIDPVEATNHVLLIIVFYALYKY